MRTTTDTFDCGTVQLQRGGTLKGAKIVYKTFGTLSPQRDNVIVYPTSYSAHHTDIEWLVDVRHGLDPSRYFIVIPNMFTNGLSSSPSNTPGEFPQVTTYDNVMQQRRLLAEQFGVDRVKMVYGWSMGAQQAYHWAALFGDAVERIVRGLAGDAFEIVFVVLPIVGGTRHDQQPPGSTLPVVLPQGGQRGAHPTGGRTDEGGELGDPHARSLTASRERGVLRSPAPATARCA